jgi:hypothetical protein
MNHILGGLCIVGAGDMIYKEVSILLYCIVNKTLPTVTTDKNQNILVG